MVDRLIDDFFSYDDNKVITIYNYQSYNVIKVVCKICNLLPI